MVNYKNIVNNINSGVQIPNLDKLWQKYQN